MMKTAPLFSSMLLGAVIFALPLQGNTILRQSVDGASREMPTETESNSLNEFVAGLQVLDMIAVKRLSTTLQFPQDLRNYLEVNHFKERNGASIWQSLKTMCDLQEILNSLWTLSSSDNDLAILSLKSLTELQVNPSCLHTQLLINRAYGRNISLLCTPRHIERICLDFELINFTEDLSEAVQVFHNVTTDDHVDIGQWIVDNIYNTGVIPEVFKAINGTTN